MNAAEFVESAVLNAGRIGMPERKVPLVAQKIAFDPGCWLWIASCKDNGYGQFNDGVRTWNAHRLVFQLAGGNVDQDQELDHLCRVRRCVNPAHLEPVTRAVNLRRQFEVITHCPQGHEYSEANTYLWRGFRHCRACRAARNKERAKNKRKADS